ncbi:MAG: T9SS type A sorting domain-containing protein [Saprospiraceae bacterium]|nr:T9SS type A sorting domain-containing protein [Saprospiraceae bacterium]
MNCRYAVLTAFLILPFFAFSQDYWFLSATNLEATVGSQVCVEANVHPSSPILSFQFTVAWDPTVVTYSSVTTTGLPTSPFYGTNFTDQGKLTCSWFGFEPYSVTERQSMFTLCFDVVGNLDDITPIEFSGDPTPIEIVDTDFNTIPLQTIPGEIKITAIPTGGQKLVSEGVVIDPGCLNNNYGEIRLFVEGGIPPLNINWNGPNGYTGAGDLITNLDPGTYTANIMDDIGFSIADTFEVQNLNPVIDTAVVNDVRCYQQNNGSINITVVDGTPPYEFTWSNGSSFEDLSSLAPGTYFLTVSDANGCTDVGSYSIGEPPALTVSLGYLNCPSLDQSNGEAGVIAEGGVGGYAYFWSDGSQTSDGVLSGVPAGNYSVSVSDDNNCPFVTEDFILDTGIAALADTAIHCDGQSISLSVEAPNAVIYQWGPESLVSCVDCQSTLVSPPTDTFITVTVYNPNLCSQTDSVLVIFEEECVWPGDPNNDGVANNEDVLWVALASGAEGPARASVSSAWQGVGASDWANSTPVSMTNYKYIDCNGDGDINDLDVDVIELNYGQMHGFVEDPDSRSVGAPLYVDLPQNVESETQYDFDLILGDADNAVAGALGFVFTLNYDPSLVDIDKIDLQLDGWFGDVQNNVYEINHKEIGVVAIGWAKSDGMVMSGAGKVGTVSVEFNNVSADTPFNFEIIGGRMINDSEGTLDLEPINTTTVVLAGPSSTEDIYDDESGLVYPNPASEKVFLKDVEFEKIRVFSSTGKLIREYNGRRSELSLEGYVNGTYLFELISDESVRATRIIIQK